MIEINCRKCTNLAATGDRCTLYGSDAKKAVAACRSELFLNYTPRKTKAEITPDTTVWLVARDEDGNATEVCGYVFLARVENAVIVSPKVNGCDLDEMLVYHIEQTAEFEETELLVFPTADCYTRKADAVVALTTYTED